MARSKSLDSYPSEFMIILQDVVKDDQTGEEFLFPVGFGGYHDVSLRTTFQSFLKAVRAEADRDKYNGYMQDMAKKSMYAIVRIRNGQVIVADRRNDRIVKELRELLAERGIVDPVEKMLQEEMRKAEEEREREEKELKEKLAEIDRNMDPKAKALADKFLGKRK